MRLVIGGTAGLVLATFLGGIAGGSQPTPDPKIQNILLDWKAKFNEYKSARYTLKGTIDEAGDLPIPEHLKGKEIRPLGEKTYPISALVLIDFTRGRIRIEETKRGASRDGRKWVPEYRVSAFDGCVYQTSLPRNRNDLAPSDPDLAVSKGNLSSMIVDSYLWPVLLTHGIVPLPSLPPRVDRLPKDHDPDEFIVSGPVIHDKRPCLVLKTEATRKTTYELWVDRGRLSAISRFIRWDDKLPSFRLDIRYQETTKPQVLESWSHISTAGGKLTVVAKLSVESVQFDVPLDDSDYTLPVSPGMLVVEYDYPPAGSGLDTRRPSQRSYRIGKDGSRTPEGEEKGFTTVEGIQIPPEGKFRWIGWMASLLLFLACVAVCWRWRRRSRSLSTKR